MSIVPTPWLLKSYSASVEAWSASMAQSASEMSASVAQSAESLSNRIDNINVSIPQSANWASTYDTVSNGSANWNDTYTEFAKISGYDYGTINIAASAVSANSGSWNDTTDTVKTSASNWGDVYDTVNQYSGTWGAGEASIPQSANWQSTYGTVSNESAKWNDTNVEFAKISGYDYSTINMAASAVSANSADWFNKNVDIPQSANWQSTYGSVSTNSAKWMSTYNDMSTNSSKYDDTYGTVNQYSASWAAGGANIPDSANWNDTYTIVQNGSANWNDTNTIVEASASNWGSVYDTVNSNSGAWGQGGITEIKVDNTTLSGDGINEAIGIKGPMLGLSAGPNINIFEKDDNIVISGAEPKAGGLDKVVVFTEQLSGDGTSNSPIGINEEFLPQIVSRYRKSADDTDEGYIGKALYVFHENYTGKKYNYIEIEDKTDTQQRFKMYTLGQPWSDMLSAGNGLSAKAIEGQGSTSNGHWEVGIQLPVDATENDNYVYTTAGWKKYEGGGEVTGDYLPMSGNTNNNPISGTVIIENEYFSVRNTNEATEAQVRADNATDTFAFNKAAWIKRHDLANVNGNMAAFGVTNSNNLTAWDDVAQSAMDPNGIVRGSTANTPIGIYQKNGNTSDGWAAWTPRLSFPMMVHSATTTDATIETWGKDNTLHFILEPES